MYIPLLSVARGHPPPHCENTQVLREAITEDDDDDDDEVEVVRGSLPDPVRVRLFNFATVSSHTKNSSVNKTTFGVF